MHSTELCFMLELLGAPGERNPAAGLEPVRFVIGAIAL
jgi:hypothetical protein